MALALGEKRDREGTGGGAWAGRGGEPREEEGEREGARAWGKASQKWRAYRCSLKRSEAPA